MELGIGLVALVVLYAMPLIGGVYTAWAGSGYLGMLLGSKKSRGIDISGRA
jgi:hypothetical protein